MKIEIFGPGCARCEALAANARSAADKLGVDYELVKVTRISEIAARGIVLTPALAIDGDIKVSGKVADEAELTTLLTSASSRQGGE